MTALAVAMVSAATLPSQAARPRSVLDSRLAAELRAVRDDATAVVFVHTDTIADAVDAVDRAGLGLLTTWDRIAVAVASGTPAAIRRVGLDRAVTYVEPSRPVQRFDASAHVASRLEDTRSKASKLLNRHHVPFDGTGVTIAINDTGVDGTHPMLVKDGRSKVVRNLRHVCADAVATCDTVVEADFNDPDGHGTAMAGVAAGYERVTDRGSLVRGVAPGSHLVSVGDLEHNFGHLSGLNWVLDHHTNPCGDRSCPPIKVVANSWGHISNYGPDGTAFDPRAAGAKLTTALVKAGVVVTFAVGNGPLPGQTNDGSQDWTVSLGKNPTPGVLAVTNYDDGDFGWREGQIRPGSSLGRRSDPTTYPDLAAPGTSITTSCSAYQYRCAPSDEVPQYSVLTGTSFSSPYVAGVVALLLQADPSLSPAEVEHVLETTAHQFGPADYVADPRNPDHTTSYDRGHGLVDVSAALAAVLGRRAPEPRCDGTGRIVDREGDATNATVFQTPLPRSASEAALDILGGGVSGDAHTGGHVFSVRLADIPEARSTTAPTAILRFFFTFRDTAYHLRMERLGEPGKPPQFYLQTDIGGTLVADALAGSFDPASDVARVVLPADSFRRWDPALPLLTVGEQLTRLRVSAARSVGTRPAGPAFLDVDHAGAPCAYVVPAPPTKRTKR